MQAKSNPYKPHESYLNWVRIKVTRTSPAGDVCRQVYGNVERACGIAMSDVRIRLNKFRKIVTQFFLMADKFSALVPEYKC